jgi:hypothetical protein
MSDYAPPVEAPVPEKHSSPFSRMVGVITSPGETFADIARRPDWVVPALAIVIVSIVVTIILVPRIDFEGTYREAFEARNMPPQQMEQALKWAVAFGRATLFVAPLFVLGGVAVAAAIYFLGVRLFGGAGTYLQTFSIVIYSWMPRVVKALITIPVALTKHGLRLTEVENVLVSNLSFLTDSKTHPVLYALLSSIDLFNLWSLVLLVIGLSVMSKLSKVKTTVLVVIVWGFLLLLRVGGAAMGAMRAKAASAS